MKTLKNLLLRNQKADGLETSYAASGARVLPNLFKWWPWVDLDLFYGKVKFAFVWEKGKTMDFSETIVVYDVKVGRCNKLNDYMNLYDYQRSRLFTDPWYNVTQIQHFQISFF